MHATPFLNVYACAGLPVHVNGYFELSSNRRAIWWSDVAADLAGEGRARSDWNLALLQARAACLFWYPSKDLHRRTGRGQPCMQMR